jgi:hypothetical protein
MKKVKKWKKVKKVKMVKKVKKVNKVRKKVKKEFRARSALEFLYKFITYRVRFDLCFILLNCQTPHRIKSGSHTICNLLMTC